MTVVGVAQLVEPRVVIPVVVGSSPIVHPISERAKATPFAREQQAPQATFCNQTRGR